MIDSAQSIRVLVVDDHPVVGQGVAQVVAGTPIEVVGCVRTLAEAESASGLRPDVVLLDLRLGGVLSSSAVPRLCRALPHARIAIFTAFPDHAAVSEALDGGACACLVKDIGQTDLVAALTALARGERCASSVRPHSASAIALSRQEAAILLRVARGETNAEIGRDLILAPNTVKTYWQNALCKLGARNRAEAITRAHAAGLL